MRDYILYHNAMKMRYDLEEAPIEGQQEEDTEAKALGLNIFETSGFYDNNFYEPDWEFFSGDDSLEDLPFSIVTSNRKESVESIGQRVWIIQGQALTIPRQYYFHGCFSPLVADRGISLIGDRRFKYRLWGEEESLYRPIHPALYLSREGWFGEVLQSFQNFRFGFREIPNSFWVARLEEMQDEVFQLKQ